MIFEQWIKNEDPTLKPESIQAVLNLAGEGATVPFIARYRKENTGNLDEVQILKIIDGKEKWDELLKRQAFIKDEIQKQEKLTPELAKKISSTFLLEALEDIYLPYKIKRKTKATKARDAGLDPLASLLWEIGHNEKTVDHLAVTKTLNDLALKFINQGLGILTTDAALQGAQDILIEKISESQDLRQFVRSQVFKSGALLSTKGAKALPHSKFEKYFSFEEKISTLLLPQNSHRYLAMRRGWLEEELKISISGLAADKDYDETLTHEFEKAACTNKTSIAAPVLLKAARLALKAHVLTSIDAEVHSALKNIADDAAIKVFSENVRKLLLSAPFGSKAILGVDPGIRTGCKIAVVNDSGKYIASTVMHTQTSEQKNQASQMLKQVLTTQTISAIAVGNGTAGRETESFLRICLKDLNLNVPVIMVNESGASVYSASDAAREEFPDLDLTIRGAISIARRLQDPLAELVKIDPKSIGVGQYQHDVSPVALKKNLEQVVDSCVNAVGVNLNTASYHLLSHVSGIGPGLAKSMVEYRSQKGIFKNRQELLNIPRFSKKVFEQAAGFLKIPESKNPLDNTGVHPERYEVLETLAKDEGKNIGDLLGSGVQLIKADKKWKEKVGAYTFDDIIKELEKPGRDVREKFSAFQFREDIHKVSDLTVGMICPGIVTNVTNFGAFVDIGVHQDGLVHISQLADKFVKDPREVVSPGDHVSVKILDVNKDKNQIALTMKKSADASHRPVQNAAPSISRSTSRSSSTSTSLSPSLPSSLSSSASFSNNPFASLQGTGSSNKKISKK
jgi:uncharacterized protein